MKEKKTLMFACWPNVITTSFGDHVFFWFDCSTNWFFSSHHLMIIINHNMKQTNNEAWIFEFESIERSYKCFVNSIRSMDRVCNFIQKQIVYCFVLFFFSFKFHVSSINEYLFLLVYDGRFPIAARLIERFIWGEKTKTFRNAVQREWEVETKKA